MITLKRTVSLFLSLALAAGMLAGCSGGEGASSSGGGSASSAPPDGSAAQEIEPMDLSAVTDPYLATAGLAGDTVVASAGQYDITAGSLLYWLNSAMDNYVSQISALGMTSIPWDAEVDGETIEDALLQSALEAAAFYRLLPELGAAEGLTLPQEELDEMDRQLQELEQEVGPGLAEHRLWAQMTTREQFVRMYESALMYSQLQELYYGEGSEGYPTDAEVLSYAQDQLGVYRAKHILIMAVDEETREPLSEELVAEKKARAEELLAQIRAAADPVARFDELMREYSEDPGLAAYPDGYTTARGEMVPEFEEAALALEPGEISDVVYSESTGYHIILRLPLDPADYRSAVVDALMGDRVLGWMEDNPIQTNDAFLQIDPSEYRAQVLSLQSAVALELETEQGDGGSSPAG